MNSDEAGKKTVVAVLDVLSPEMRTVLQQRFGAEFDLRFSEEGDDAGKLANIREATVLLPNWSPVPANIIDEAKNCKLIQKLGVGTDKIDLEAAKRNGVVVLRSAGINANAVADFTVLLVLAIIRRLRWAAEELRAGRFQKEALRASTYELSGRTVGLVGAGHIGRAAARRFASFGCNILYYDVKRLSPETEAALGVTFAPVKELVAKSDIISLHIPNTPETKGMFNADLFGKMKRGAIIVNTARGALIDETALVDAINQGIVLGAGLDVTSVEPPPASSPLLSMEQVLLTPHMAGAVADNFPRVVEHVFANVKSVLSGGDVPADDIAFWPEG